MDNISVTFFKISHSIPDCLGIVFHTPEGIVVHTGDFKFDLTPVNNQYSDIHKMAEIGTKGVLLLLSESTNAERPGSTPSERLVGEHIDRSILRREAKNYHFYVCFQCKPYSANCRSDGKNESKTCFTWPKYGKCSSCSY